MALIQLNNGCCSATVLTLGAQLASLKVNDREIMWQTDPKVWGEYGPVLFPVCGAVTSGMLGIHGADYPMAKHGFANHADFSVCRQGDDFVDLVLTQSDATLAMYPFSFALHVVYTLNERGVTTSFVVENHSDAVMPFCLGGHPAFIVPMEDGAAFEDYQVVFPHVEEGKNSLVPSGGLIDGYDYLPTFHHADTLPIDHQLFDERDSLVFTELKSRSLKLVNKHTGKGLRLDYPKFEVLVIWTMPGTHGDYLCLEPWHGMPGQVTENGSFVDKPYATMLAPGRCWQGSFTTTVLD